MKEEAGLEPLLAFPLLLKAPSLQFLHSCGSSLFCYRGLQWNSDFHGGVPGTWGEADREKRNRAQPASSQSPILIGHQQSLELSKTLCSSLTIWESSLKSQVLPFFFFFLMNYLNFFSNVQLSHSEIFLFRLAVQHMAQWEFSVVTD